MYMYSITERPFVWGVVNEFGQAVQLGSKNSFLFLPEERRRFGAGAGAAQRRYRRSSITSTKCGNGDGFATRGDPGPPLWRCLQLPAARSRGKGFRVDASADP